MMQAYAEGFELMHKSEFPIELAEVAHLWQRGSVVRSWLCELAANAFKAEQRPPDLRGVVGDSGEGRWTIPAAHGPSTCRPGDHGVVVRPLLLPWQRRLHGARAGRPAQSVRRARRRAGQLAR